MRSISPFLWFDDAALPAAKLYTSIFRGSRILSVTHAPKVGGGARRRVASVEFEIAGQRVLALNGGPIFRPTPAFSFFVSCANQADVDQVWDRLVRGGEPSRCGWLVDRFGLSWQVIPDRLIELLNDKDPVRAARATQAMLKMQKIVVAALERAVRGA